MQVDILNICAQCTGLLANWRGGLLTIPGHHMAIGPRLACIRFEIKRNFDALFQKVKTQKWRST